MITIGALAPSDREVWESLFRAYIDFYQRVEPPEMYERAWREFQVDTRLHAFGARLDSRLVGITHFLVHPSTSGPDVCYLQDLFTAPDARGNGVARALIPAVTDWAQAHDCGRVYWTTHESNTTARSLYDQVAENRGFIRYQIDLSR
ncbi:MAG TPA: GNAT family N-acetyltransferase [Ktedonobacterales bacterium]|jgi:GNAT superfamily N-acetyltransferase|nr:GNAT family N-acetyltransferase [Ktedonobacterales bacterium]